MHTACSEAPRKGNNRRTCHKVSLCRRCEQSITRELEEEIQATGQERSPDRLTPEVPYESVRSSAGKATCVDRDCREIIWGELLGRGLWPVLDALASCQTGCRDCKKQCISMHQLSVPSSLSHHIAFPASGPRRGRWPSLSRSGSPEGGWGDSWDRCACLWHKTNDYRALSADSLSSGYLGTLRTASAPGDGGP